MGDPIPREDEAKGVAHGICEDVEHKESHVDRHTFRYDGVVQCHTIAEGWDVIGFGSSWFAIAPK